MNEEIKERIDMINRGEVPKGYKKTKVGIIPEDWEVCRLKKLGEFYRGKEISKAEIIDEGVECITYGEIYTDYHYIVKNLNSRINEKSAKNSLPIQKNDILFTGSGETLEEIGKCVAYLGEGQAYAGGDIIVFRPKNTNGEFLGYLLNNDIVNYQKYRLGQGHSVVHIYVKDLETILIPILSYKEQQRIAQILSTWDKAIELKGKLIEEKEEQKKGLMQRLLTGEVRLPGFEGEWEEVRLGDVATMSSGGTPRSTVSEYYDGDIPWVSISDMTEQGKYVNSTAKNISKLGLKNSSAKLYPKGTVLYAMYASIGECSIATVELSSSQAILGIQVGKLLNNEFLFYYLISIKEKLKLQGQQGTQSNLNAGMVRNLKIPLPEIDEQIGIVRILLINDKEIDLLNQELEQLKEQKKGLMQLLLTGKIRVSLQ